MEGSSRIGLVKAEEAASFRRGEGRRMLELFQGMTEESTCIDEGAVVEL